MSVLTQEHHWVKHTITPVSTLIDNEGQPIVFVDPEQQTIAEDNAVYGCDRCGVPMAGYHGSLCDPEGMDD